MISIKSDPCLFIGKRPYLAFTQTLEQKYVQLADKIRRISRIKRIFLNTFKNTSKYVDLFSARGKLTIIFNQHSFLSARGP